MSPSALSPATALDAAFEADAFEALAIDVPGADVTLRPADTEALQVRVEVPEATPEEARRVFEKCDLAPRRSGNRLQIHGAGPTSTVADWRWRRQLSTTVHLTVRVPSSLSVRSRVPGGRVDLAEIAGPVHVTAPGATVRARALRGPLRVEGSGGALAVKEAGDALNLRWSSGEVSVRDTRAPVDVIAHGAPLTLQHVAGPCEAAVHGASLTYHGAPESDVALRTTGAPLSAHLPATHAATLSLKGARVTLDSDFALDGTQTARHVAGTLRGGGPRPAFQAGRAPVTGRAP